MLSFSQSEEKIREEEREQQTTHNNTTTTHQFIHQQLQQPLSAHSATESKSNVRMFDILKWSRGSWHPLCCVVLGCVVELGVVLCCACCVVSCVCCVVLCGDDVEQHDTAGVSVCGVV